MNKTTWMDIETNWINGNRKEAKRLLLKHTKLGLLKLFMEVCDEDLYEYEDGLPFGITQLKELMQYCLKTCD